jgi:poly-gamma-glutamate synthesis protein (capsule biosynthesis protein)
MSHRSILAAAAVTALALTGCTTAAGDGPGRTTAGASTASPAGDAPGGPTPTPSATASPTATATPLPDTITLAFGGDIHFADYLAPLATEPDGLASLRATLGAADLSMANLETSITTRGTQTPKEFHFRAPPSALQTLAGAGIDVVTMANNHAFDYGSVGFRDTLAARKTSPIPIVGVGATTGDAFSPATFRVGGVRIAVFGADQVFDITLAQHRATSTSGGVAASSPVTRLRDAVAKARPRYDLVVVYLHWGGDYQTCPRTLDVATARTLEQAGADIVVGSHSHRVNGAGWLGKAYVDYGLGNFVWWRSHEPDSRTGVLTLTVDATAARAGRARASTVVTKARWTPMLIGTDGIPAIPSKPDTTRLRSLWNDARRCAGLASAPR